MGNSTSKSPVSIDLPTSKSITNRLLILQKLFDGNLGIQNLSTADDTTILKKTLNSTEQLVDVGMAGTAFRFLTAFFAISEGERILTGDARMMERPIGPLVKALKTLGADIEYLGKEHCPPLKIRGKRLIGGKVSIDANVSSQFVSALMLIAPKMRNGLQLHLRGKVVSEPYILMTAKLLEQCGVKVKIKNNRIDIDSVQDIKASVAVEKDWSAASFFYNALCCSSDKRHSVFFPSLKLNSIQGDSALAEIYSHLGIKTSELPDGILISKEGIPTDRKEFDFSQTPDLVQPFLVSCAALGRKVMISGIETLRIKETDRIVAMQKELAKLACSFVEGENGVFQFLPSETWPLELFVNTYNDHRMAMSFAGLFPKISNFEIDKPNVVSKSFPHFWEEMQKLSGFNQSII